MFCHVCQQKKPCSKGGDKTTTCAACLAEGLKYCNACCRILSLTAFGKDTLGRPRSSCKECQAYKSAKSKRIKYHNDNDYRIKRLEQNHERRTSVESGYTVDEWHAKAASYGFACAYCGASSNITSDHIVPLSAGGTNYIQNIVPACGSCNYSKGPRDLIEWYTTQPFFSKERLMKILTGGEPNE